MNILAIGAHFDDVELGCGGSLVKWRDQGHRLSVFVATRSGYHDQDGNAVRTDAVARREGRAALKRLGAKVYEGGFSTNRLVDEEPLKKKLLAVIRAVKPDLALIPWQEDVHLDHRALAAAALSCCRHVTRLFEYRVNWYESGRPFRANYLVDISKTLEEKIALVKMHRSEFGRTGGKWETFLRAQAALHGLQAGTAAAEGFEVVKWLD